MRDRMKNHSRRARRRAALLTLLMMVGPTPTMGDQPSSQTNHWMPPLPLNAQSSQGSVQPNPFCQTPQASSAPSSADTEQETVQLASGRPPLVQLKPVGSAVGLVPIDDASGRHQRSAIGVTDPASSAKVQVNPLVKAAPHAPAPPATNAPHVESETAADGTAAARNGGNAVAKEAVAFSLSDQPSAGLPDPARAEEISRPDPTSPRSTTVEPKKIASGRPEAAASQGWISVSQRHTAVPERHEPATAEPAKILPEPTKTTAEPAKTAVARGEATAEPAKILPEPAKTTAAPAKAKTAAEPAKIVSSGRKAALEVSDVSPPKTSADAQPSTQPEQSTQPKTVSPRPMLVQEAAPIAISGAASEEVASKVTPDPREVTPDSREVRPKVASKVAPDPLEVTPDPRQVSPDPREVASRTQETPGRADRQTAQPARESQRLAAEADASRRSANEPSHVASRVESTERGGRLATAAQRYRPPVAIAAPPLAVERPATDPAASIVRPTVKTVAALELDSTELNSIERSQPSQESPSVFETKSAGASGSQHVQLHLDAAQVRSLTIGGKLRRVQVADDRICQAIATGASELKLIGVSDGRTQLSVWADPADGGETQQRIFNVRVGGRSESAGHSIGDAIAMLNRSIDNAFPMAQVTVRQLRDRLVVSGHCASEDSATEIIRLVRKTCLIPVRDELVVR